MSQIVLTKAQLRQFILYYQGLVDNKQQTYEASKFNAAENLVKRIGCIQYDPLNVVGKNPDLVLHSRIHDYKQGDIDYLLYEKRSLIDAWDKMMSIYLAEDFPYFKRLRERKAIEIEHTLKFRGSEAATEFTEQAIEIIADRGPLLASQIDFGKTSKGSLLKLHVTEIKEPFYMRTEDYHLLEASLESDVETTKSAINVSHHLTIFNGIEAS